MSAPYSYYDATLALIRAAVAESALTCKAIAARLGISADTLARKLSGEETLMVSEIGTIAKTLGVRMSAIVA
ncbi:helix-turn-helix domain-containing protein [Arthrobacter sp. E3]|uniref:helix-turn-helix domain-containing protein n=1 Tax=Arthrobacter sp. E3 TaxID=517402 RepID=UPI001A95111F|nr:helix-turn-helix domain-containing protein [Arthrobacter sp. E3]